MFKVSNTFKVYERVIKIKDVLENIGEDTDKLTEKEVTEVYYKLGEIMPILLGERRKRR